MAADTYIVEQGKLGGKYKPVYEGESRGKAWREFYAIKLESGYQKRIKRNGKKIAHVPCYWT